MTGAPSPAVWTFDDFLPGSVLGRLSIALDAQRIAHWTAIYGLPTTLERLPSGLLVAAMMEAYLRAIQPRPPGNIHASQTLRFGGAARPGDELQAEVACVAKELRRERRWVTFGVSLRNGSKNILGGEIRTIWAK
jgi:acyl dehydratase